MGSRFCNHARGPQFFAFRNFMLGNMKLPLADLSCKDVEGAPAELQVVFGLRSPNWHGFMDEKVDAGTAVDWRSTGEEIGAKLQGVAVASHFFSEMTVKEQAALLSQTAVLVQLSGGSSSTAIFLPRGATLVHVAPVKVKDDYALWSQMSHISVHWIELSVHKTLLDRGLLLLAVADAIGRYHEFNRCYDADAPGKEAARFTKIAAGVAAVGAAQRAGSTSSVE
jgi:hypothetical protein